MRWLDLLHARYQNDAFFFVDGWGDQDILGESLIQRALPAPAESKPLKKEESERIIRFPSPRIDHLPEESKLAEALVVMPPEWTVDTPVCVQLAATGDEGFMDRRRVVAGPLLEAGIGSVILENPFYGRRKPKRPVSYTHLTLPTIYSV